MEKLSRFTLFLLIVITFNSCFISKSVDASKAKSEFTEENNAIPPAFGKKGTVLLCVLQKRNSYDKYLKSAVKKNYNGEYLLVSEAQLNSEEYSDKEKYRFVFDYSEGKKVYSTNSSQPAVYKRFFVKDRLENKIYQSGAEFTFFAKAMKVYFENLEKKRNASLN